MLGLIAKVSVDSESSGRARACGSGSGRRGAAAGLGVVSASLGHNYVPCPVLAGYGVGYGWRPWRARTDHRKGRGHGNRRLLRTREPAALTRVFQKQTPQADPGAFRKDDDDFAYSTNFFATSIALKDAFASSLTSFA